MVWQVKEFTFQTASLDFTSSGQGRQEVTQLLFDGEVFANATHATSWDQETFQVLVCNSCGIEGCEYGNWFQMRGLGASRLFTPRAEDECDYRDWDRRGGSRLVARNGVPLLGGDMYAALRERLLALPADPPAITSLEAVGLVALEAPARLLSRQARELKLHAALLLAVSDGELEATVPQLRDILDVCAASPKTPQGRELPQVRELQKGDEPLTFYMNDADLTEWTPIVRQADGVLGLLLGNQVLRP